MNATCLWNSQIPRWRRQRIFPDVGIMPRIKQTVCQRTFYHLSWVVLCLFFLSPARRMIEHYPSTGHGYFNTRFTGRGNCSQYSSLTAVPYILYKCLILLKESFHSLEYKKKSFISPTELVSSRPLWFSQNATIISPFSINWLTFVEMYVVRAARNGLLNVKEMNFMYPKAINNLRPVHKAT